MQIEASALAVERGGRVIFSHLGFRLAGGEALLVKGPNGAGKSSLLRAIAGLLPLAAGVITLTPGEPRRGDACHYLGHLDALKPSLTTAENLAFWAALLGRGAEHRSPSPDFGHKIATALTRLGLAPIADLPVAYLSAGQKRRAALARLLAVARPLWLLDEPTTALDAAGQTALAAIMDEHLAAGGMIIAASHAPIAHATHELTLGGAS